VDAETVAPWYVPHAAQRRLHAARRTRFVSVLAGRRGGKTLGTAVEFVDRIFEDVAAGKGRACSNPDMAIFEREPSLVYWVVSPQSALYAVALRHFLRALPRVVRAGFAARKVSGYLRSPHPRFWLPGDALVEFRSGENPDDLVSEGLHGLWLNEAARLKPTVWEGNLQPVLAEHRGWGLTDSTPLGRNWWWDHFLRRADPRDEKHSPDYATISWHTVENRPPSETVARRFPRWAEEARNLQAEVANARLHMDPVAFRREYEASTEAFKGQVYGLTEGTHDFAGPLDPRSYPRTFAGFDWGRGNPGCLLVIGERDGRYDVLHEWYESGLTARSWAQRMREAVRTWRVQTIWCDPSTPILPDLRDARLPVEPSASRSVLEGIECVQGLVASKRLRVYAGCPNTWRELTGYRWRETQAGTGDEPLKKDDHACFAAGTPVLLRRGWTPIERVAIGDDAWTRAGWRPVTASWKTADRARLLRAEFTNGAVLRATGNHPFFVEGKGFVHLDAIRYADTMLGCPSPRKWSGTADDIDATRTAGSKIGTGIARPPKEPCDCTARSGKRRTVQFRPATTSTTSTGTAPTTGSSTSRAFPKAITSVSTATRNTDERKRGGISGTPSPLPPHGTGAKRGARGIASTGAKCGKRGSRSERRASGAATASGMRASEARGASARTPASRRGDGTRGSTTSRSLASGAGRLSGPTATRKTAFALAPVRLRRAVIPCGVGPVYNLTVDGAHEFLAGGVLVSNCDAARYALASESPTLHEEVRIPGARRVEQDLDDTPRAPRKYGDRRPR